MSEVVCFPQFYHASRNLFHRSFQRVAAGVGEGTFGGAAVSVIGSPRRRWWRRKVPGERRHLPRKRVRPVPLSEPVN